MHDFSVGDRVEVISFGDVPTEKFEGSKGTIHTICDDYHDFPIRVVFDEGPILTWIGSGRWANLRLEELRLLDFTSNIPEPNDEDLV